MRFELGTYADAVQTISRNKLGHVALFLAAFWAFSPFAFAPALMTTLFGLVWSVIALSCLCVTARQFETTNGRISLFVMVGLAVFIMCMTAGVLSGLL